MIILAILLILSMYFITIGISTISTYKTLRTVRGKINYILCLLGWIATIIFLVIAIVNFLLNRDLKEAEYKLMETSSYEKA